MSILEIKQKIEKKIFPSLDNCISIGSRKFSQFRRGYLSTTLNVLTNTPEISHIPKRDIFQICFLQSDEKYEKIALMQISQVFGML